jgi:spoIIIJ-associated protein
MADKKFSPMRYTASTEEAAINGALQIVGASRDEIEHEVLEQSAKGVTIRIRPRSADSAPVEAPPEALEPAVETALETSAPIAEDVPELLEQSDEAAEEVEEPDSEIEAQIGDDLDSLAADFADETPDFESEAEGELPQDEPAVSEPVATQTAPEIPALDPEIVARAQQKAQEILDKMGLEAQAQVEPPKEAGVAALVIEGDDVGILIGKHGATLQAFQYLLNLSLNAHLEGEEARASGARVVVDAGNYRARRSSSLEQIARSAASKVRREGRVVRLEPMPAHERRLVHMFLQTESDVVTQSEGREPMRRIVVAPGTGGGVAPTRPERAPSSNSGGNRSGFGSFRRGDAQSERRSGLQRGR